MKWLPKNKTTEVEENSSEAKKPEQKSEAKVDSGADKSMMHDHEQVLGYLDSLRKENVTLKKSQEILKSIEKNLAMTEGKLLDAENKLKDMDEARACKICMDQDVCIAFIPCGHLVTCSECASKCMICPMCRKPIQSQLKTFMS